jgi:hypothetical protein
MYYIPHLIFHNFIAWHILGEEYRSLSTSLCSFIHYPTKVMQSISLGPQLSVWTFCNKICFYAQKLLPPCPTPKLEDLPLSDVYNYLFNLFTAILYVGGHSSICNLKTCHAIMTYLENITVHTIKNVLVRNTFQKFRITQSLDFSIVVCLK